MQHISAPLTVRGAWMLPRAGGALTSEALPSEDWITEGSDSEAGGVVSLCFLK